MPSFFVAEGIGQILGSTVLRAIAGFVISTVIKAVFTPKPKLPDLSASIGSSNRTVSVRQPISPWQWIYGEARVGGTITFLQTDPNDKTVLHMVVTLAGHVCEEIGDVYFDDEVVTFQDNGNAIGRYHGYAYCWRSLGNESDGSPSAQPFPELVAASGGTWTDAHRQSGRTKLYIRLYWSADLFASGIPNVSAVVRGRKVLDPRLGSPDVELWTDNALLCQLDYLTHAVGFGADYGTEVDADRIVAAANAADEEVPLAGDTTPVVFDESSGELTFPAGARLPRIGAGVRFVAEGSPPGALPAGLVAGTTYYVFHTAGGKAKLATSLANARARAALSWGASPAASGTVTLVYYSEPRYALNGAFKIDGQPKQIMEGMLAASAGKAVNVGGEWQLYAGVWDAPTLTFDEGDLAGPLQVQTLVSRRENANGVKGQFTDPDQAWQPTDFPALPSATYLAEDGGERVWLDVDYSPFVTSRTQAQRLSKIALLSLRQGLTVQAPHKLLAWQAVTGATLALDNTKFGWSGKSFEVVGSRFTFADDGTLGVEHSLRETAAAVFDWDASEEQGGDLAPNTELPDPFADLDLEDLTASSGTSDLLLNGDGTVVPRVRLRWTAPANGFLHHYEIQFAPSGASPTEWTDAPNVIAPATEGFALPVVDADSYDLRARAVTVLGNGGAWAYVLGHLVIGKTAAPSDVTGFFAVQSGDSVLFSVDPVEDADLDLIEIRLADEGNTDWDDAQPLVNILRGRTSTSKAVPPGSWTFLAKARDTSGNYSDAAASADAVVTADGFTSIASRDYAPGWTGALTHMVRHWTGVLTPESRSLASALGWEVFDEFVPDAETDCYFETPEIDKSIDASARIWGDIVSVLGPGETSGTASPALEVDYRTNAGSYDGFETWSLGAVNFRYCKGRIHVDTTVGKPVISAFELNVDAESRRESGTLTVGGGGSGSVTFATQFHNTPVVQVTPQGSGDVTASAASIASTGFTGYFKSGGIAAAGSMNYTAEGV